MSNNINKLNVALLKEDNYYHLAKIPGLFYVVAEEAGRNLINHIMQRFLDGKFSQDLRIVCPELKPWVTPPNSETIVLNVNDYKRVLKKYISNQKWESIVEAINDDPTALYYKPYVDQEKIMIHVEDIIQVLNKYNLNALSKKLSSSLGNKGSKKILRSKRDWEIIKIYQKIKKQYPALGDHKIAMELKKYVKKDKRKKISTVKINQEISNLDEETIANIISGYYSNLIKRPYKEYRFNNEIKVQHIINGIESREKEKENEAQAIKLKISYKKGYCYNEKEKSYIVNNNTHFYDSNRKCIDDLYKQHGTKPTIEQIVEALDEGFIKFITKNLNRPEHSILSIILNIQEKSVEIKQLTSGEQLLDKVSRYIDVFSRDDLMEAVKCIPDKEVQERLIEEALADKSVKGVTSLDDNSESNEPKKYIRITTNQI